MNKGKLANVFELLNSGFRGRLFIAVSYSECDQTIPWLKTD